MLPSPLRSASLDPAPADPQLADESALTSRELLWIVAFWTLYALLIAANRLLDALGRSPDRPLHAGWLVVSLVDSLCWVAVTPIVFWLAGRYGTDRVPTPRRIALFIGVGIAAALLVGFVGFHTRMAFDPSPFGTTPARRRPPNYLFGLLNAFVIYLGVLATGLARAYSLRYRARREQTAVLQRQLAEVRLDALRRQLDPHFLFNTLNVVSSLVERDPRGVRRMISRLGDLLRFSLEGADEPEIPLGRELELLGRYLDIMQVRFQGRLEVEQCIAPDTLDALVPSMILQPLVENAIKHGVEARREGGRIVLESTIDGDSLVLRVRDNGPGVVWTGPTPARTGTGVGIRNTVARLEQLYGGAQRFTLAPAPEGGTLAEVRLPRHTRSLLMPASVSMGAVHG